MGSTCSLDIVPRFFFFSRELVAVPLVLGDLVVSLGVQISCLCSLLDICTSNSLESMSVLVGSSPCCLGFFVFLGGVGAIGGCV